MISYMFPLEEEPLHRPKMDFAVSVCILVCGECVVSVLFNYHVITGNKSPLLACAHSKLQK